MLDADFDGMDKLVWIPTTFHPDADKARLASKLEAGVLMPGVLERVRDPREMEALGETVDDEVIRRALLRRKPFRRDRRVLSTLRRRWGCSYCLGGPRAQIRHSYQP